jgi:hypothetical protein
VCAGAHFTLTWFIRKICSRKPFYRRRFFTLPKGLFFPIYQAFSVKMTGPAGRYAAFFGNASRSAF